MEHADNTESKVQAAPAQTGDTGSMNTTETSTTTSTLAVHSEQAMPFHEAGRGEISAGFFAVGVVINLVMITAYFIWAYKQWFKTGTSEEGRGASKAVARDE